MLRKIVVNNIGVLKAFSTPASPRLDRLTVFYARNGRGKTTLTAVLRAARTGEAAAVLGRRSLGNGSLQPEVVLVREESSIRFGDGSWSSRSAPIEVFDSAFIADNIFAGELTDLHHDRGLFSVIVGAEGVRLAKRLEFFVGVAKQRAGRLKAAETALAGHLPYDLTIEEFLAFLPSPKLTDDIAEAEKAIAGVQQFNRVSSLGLLKQVAIPEVPAGIADTLCSTVEQISANARDRMLRHFQRFGLGKKGEEWIRFGLEHVHEDGCPFCGRSQVDETGLITAYGQIFSDLYKGHLSAIQAELELLDSALGPQAVREVGAAITANLTAAAAWSEYARLDGSTLPDASGIAEELSTAYLSLRALLDRKRQSPLDVLSGTGLSDAEAHVARAQATLRQFNAAVVEANQLIQRARSAAATQTEEQAKRRSENLRRRRNRLEPNVQARIEAYLSAKRQEERARKARTVTQSRLKDENRRSAHHYHSRVNHHLGRFGASFVIGPITSSMAGNAGSTDYGLIIRGEEVARGRGRSPVHVPSFHNSLSTGDKTTLAFAFFLAAVEADTKLNEKTVVFDDPLSSHDSHRKGKTIEALQEISLKGKQLIVLSHDQYFLRELCRACSGLRPTAYQIEFKAGDRWSSAEAVNPDDLCKSEHAKQVDALRQYVHSRSGDPDSVVLHVRRVLETHFRRSFSAWFSSSENLGKIVQIIRAEGQTHPCFSILPALAKCNEATCDRHHGEDAELVARTGVEPDELAVIVGDCLQLINAIRPASP